MIAQRRRWAVDPEVSASKHLLQRKILLTIAMNAN